MGSDFFPKRAVEMFYWAAKEKRLSPRHVKNVLKYKRVVDVSCLIPFLRSEDGWTRRCAAQAIGGAGRFGEIIKVAADETEKETLLAMLRVLFKSREGIEELVAFLNSEDQIVRETTIQMFRRAGRADCLMTLLFDTNDETVERVRGYMREQDGKKESTD